MGILADFYMGAARPWGGLGVQAIQSIKMCGKKIESLEHPLMVGRSEKGQNVRQKFKHLRTVQNNMGLERMSLYAFPMGAAFALDLFGG